jgi:hypothetical protein
MASLREPTSRTQARVQVSDELTERDVPRDGASRHGGCCARFTEIVRTDVVSRGKEETACQT